jgi:four helix bundle protein
MRRAAVSIPSNIAEGFRRKHAKEYRQFLGIALGSCGELETQLEVARRLAYLDKEQYQKLVEELEYLCRMTQTLMGKLVTHDSRLTTQD